MQIDGYSLDAQKTKMKAFCDYNGYEIAGEYEAETGNVIIETFRDQHDYSVYSKWMEYVYNHFPVDHAYWKMRAVEGYKLYAQLEKPMEAFAMRTISIWDYYDTEKEELDRVPMDPRGLALLKLCGGKLRVGQIIGLLENDGWQREEAIARLAEYERRKWILFAEI